MTRPFVASPARVMCGDPRSGRGNHPIAVGVSFLGLTERPEKIISAAHSRAVPTTMSELAEGLETRRKRLRFQAWHRGTREMDLILGRFVDSAIAGLGADELAELEHLFNWPDPDLFAWIMGQADVPPVADTAILKRIVAFHFRAGAQLSE